MTTRARRKDPSRVAAGHRGAITRRARAEGKDPARVHAALKGWDARRKGQEHAARVHGQKAREKTERALTPAQRRARTRDADRIEHGGGGEGSTRGGGGSGSRDGGDTLDDYYDDFYDEWDEYDVETSPDYEEASA